MAEVHGWCLFFSGLICIFGIFVSLFVRSSAAREHVGVQVAAFFWPSCIAFFHGWGEHAVANRVEDVFLGAHCAFVCFFHERVVECGIHGEVDFFILHKAPMSVFKAPIGI